MACEIMLQRGKTLPNMLNARLERAAAAIIPPALYSQLGAAGMMSGHIGLTI